MATPRPSLLNLHPVEALLALLLISAAAIARLLRPQPLIRVTSIQPQASAAPAVATVADLRRMVRARGLSEAGGRPIHKARRADLIEALCSY
jgi:hypothetical protein